MWDNTRKGRWTRRLIPDIRRWTERGHGEVGYHLTQALTGHGCFVEYLYDIGKKESRECVYCGENDDAEHTVFYCNRWDDVRVHEVGGTHLSPDNMIELMLQSEVNWRLIEESINHIMKTKEADERELAPDP